MIESNYEREFTAIAKEYEKSGGNVSDFLRKDIVSIIVSGNKVIGRNTVDGVHVRAKELDNGVEIWIDIDDGTVIENPIHLCTGYLKPEGTQEILIHNHLGDRARVKFISHCVFPSGVNFTHSMVADTDVGKIFKIVIDTKAVSDLASTRLTGANGVFFDQPNNRLITVPWKASAPVSEVDLDTGAVSVLINTPYSNTRA